MAEGRDNLEAALNSPASDLLRLLSREEDQVPKGWLSARQIAAETGSTIARVETALRRLTEAGRAEVKEYRIRIPGGIIRHVKHYKV